MSCLMVNDIDAGLGRFGEPLVPVLAPRKQGQAPCGCLRPASRFCLLLLAHTKRRAESRCCLLLLH